MTKKPFDLLAEFAKFGAEKKLSLKAPQAAPAFIKHVDDAVKLALGDPILLHGQRIEAMFEAMVVSLGAFRLLKPEDNGRIYPGDQFRAPDFRIVLDDGTQWLVEVKNIHHIGMLDQKRRVMTRNYRESLEAYAKATGAELKLAAYWSKLAIWTLVSPNRLTDADGDVRLDMGTALKANELGRLGDRTIGTRPPLRLRLTADPARTSAIAPDGTVNITISRAQVFCGDKEVTDPVDQEIAWLFMQYGRWEEAGPDAVVEGDRLEAIEFKWEPTERLNENFEFVGSLSQMFSRYYAEHTVDKGEIVQLRAPLRPKWFDPLVQGDRISDALPLWKMVQQPDYGDLGKV